MVARAGIDRYIRFGESERRVGARSNREKRKPTLYSWQPQEGTEFACRVSKRCPTNGSNSRFVIASAISTFNNEKYVVEVGAPNKPIKAVFRQAAFALVIGLVVGLALVTWGSVFLIKRALAPVQKIAQSVQALPLAHPDERIRAVVVREQIENLFDTVNEMVSQLEVSFQIGTGLPAEAFHALSTRLRRVHEDLADSLESEGLSIGVAAKLLCLLKETEPIN